MWPNPQYCGLVLFSEEILHGFHFLNSVPFFFQEMKYQQQKISLSLFIALLLLYEKQYENTWVISKICSPRSITTSIANTSDVNWYWSSLLQLQGTFEP